MKLLKRILFVLIIMSFCISPSMASYKYFESYLDSGSLLLKVGLMHSKIDNDNVLIESDTNLDLYIESNRVEHKLLSFNEKAVVLSKGSSHIRVSDYFYSEDAIMTEIEKLKKVSVDIYPVYKDGWYIGYGSYSSDVDGLRDLESIKAKFGFKDAVLVSSITLVDIRGFSKVMSYDSEQGDFYVKPSDDSKYLKINEGVFRGGIGAKRFSTSDLTVINYIDIEKYLYGVVPREMDGQWNIEALKAQSVAARNYAVINIDKHKKYGFDVCSSIDCQVYGGVKSEMQGSNSAVDQTKGVLLMYNNLPAEAYFHSNSGGHTEDSENIWSTKVPYLRGVEDKYSLYQPNAVWEKSFSGDQLGGYLDKAGFNTGKVKNVVINKLSVNNRVMSITFVGERGVATLEKEKVRSVIGYSNIKSIWYEIAGNEGTTFATSGGIETSNKPEIIVLSKDGPTTSKAQNLTAYNGKSYSTLTQKSVSSDLFTFRGYGYGHGLGMSQYGAKVMAENGFSYDQILTHYYSGTYLINNN